ncbi:MAG: regulatory protein GemA [Rhizobiaceae bacterium]|nr:regulatory protein GemA [Rhizobiaceae bacterium]
MLGLDMHRPRKSSSIPAKKIALLHVAKRQLGLDEDTYRDILRRFGGVESSADLDPVEFEAVMIRMAGLGFRSTWTKRTFGDRHSSMASAAQVELMRSLWEKYDPADEDEKHLNAWLRRFHGVSAMRFVSAKKAKSVITALKAMVARQ